MKNLRTIGIAGLVCVLAYTEWLYVFGSSDMRSYVFSHLGFLFQIQASVIVGMIKNPLTWLFAVVLIIGIVKHNKAVDDKNGEIRKGRRVSSK
ncbi:hypothetical protein [Viridibacillus arvi]|uniref:hypothetical protein n=1 Tax=Viridibacillus arvi TaxID=263475 RepID=UPI0034CE2292